MGVRMIQTTEAHWLKELAGRWTWSFMCLELSDLEDGPALVLGGDALGYLEEMINGQGW